MICFEVKYCLVFFSILLSFTIEAQSFKSGYFINLDGEKVTGFIKEDKVKRVFIKFKESFESEYIFKLKPTDILGYEVEDYGFCPSADVVMENQSKMMFLERIIEGEIVSLFQVRTDKGDKIYLLEKDDEIRQVPDKSPSRFFENYFAGCDSALVVMRFYNVFAVDYRAMKAMVQRYNRCHGGKIKEKKQFDRRIFAGFKLGGISGKTGLFRFANKNFDAFEAKNIFAISGGFVFGITFSNWVNLESGISYFRFDMETVRKLDDQRPEYSARISNVNIPVRVKVGKRLNKFKPYAQIGIEYRKFPKIQYIEKNGGDRLDLKSWGMGWFFGAGGNVPIKEDLILDISFSQNYTDSVKFPDYLNPGLLLFVKTRTKLIEVKVFKMF